MTHLKSFRSIAFVLALASLTVADVAAAQVDAGVPAPDAATPPPAEGEETQTVEEEIAPPPAVTPSTEATDPAAPAEAAEAVAAEEEAEQAEATQLAAPTPPPAEEEEEEEPAPAPSEDESQAAEAQAAAEPLAWRNSFLSWTQGVTFNTFLRDSQLTYNPTYYHWIFINPRWYIDAQTFFVLGASGYIEATDDDSSAYNHEFQLGDLTVELRRTIAWEGFIFIPSARLTFPLSKISQGAQRYVNTGVGVTIVRPIPEALGMTLAAGFAYRRWWAGSATTLFQGQCATAANPRASMGEGELAGGLQQLDNNLCQGVSPNEADRILASLTINVTPFEGFTVSLSGAWVWSQAFALGAYTIDGSGVVTAQPSGGIPDTSNHWRNFTSYSLSVAYDILPWFNLSLGFSNSTNLEPLYAEDGSIRSPFNPNSQLTLTAQFTLDGIYEELFGGDEDDGLTPEERQRRRQGLAQRDSDDEEQMAPSGATSPNSGGTPVTF